MRVETLGASEAEREEAHQAHGGGVKAFHALHANMRQPLRATNTNVAARDPRGGRDPSHAAIVSPPSPNAGPRAALRGPRSACRRFRGRPGP